MNSMSWLIYFISIIDVLRDFMVFGMVVSIIVVIGTTIFRFIANDDRFLEDMIPSTIKIRKRCIITAIVLALFIAFVPKKDTIILIAASEIGERVINSETGREIVGEVRSVVTPSTELLRTWIEDQTRKIRANAAGQ